MRIDHVIYGTSDLDAAAARMEAELGLAAVPGGRHAGLGTHNRIVPAGDGSFIELLAVADPEEAERSALGSALQAGIARGDRLLGWAVAVEDVAAVSRRLGTALDTVGREGMTAHLTGVREALAEPCLPFFIERDADASVDGGTETAIDWIEVAGDAASARAMARRRGAARAGGCGRAGGGGCGRRRPRAAHRGVGGSNWQQTALVASATRALPRRHGRATGP